MCLGDTVLRALKEFSVVFNLRASQLFWVMNFSDNQIKVWTTQKVMTTPTINIQTSKLHYI